MVDQAESPSSDRTLAGGLPVPLDIDTLLESISDYVLALDGDGKYMWAAATNPRVEDEALAEVARQRARWLVGKTLFDVFPEREARRLHEAIVRVLNTGAKESISYRIEPWEEGTRWFDATLVRLTDGIALWAARDVTEVTRTQLELESWRERHLSLVNSIDAIVWEADVPFTRFTFISEQAERLLGYPVDRWLNEPDFWAGHMHPDDAGWCISFCETKAAAGEPHDFEYRMIAADGRTVWLRDIVTVVTENGRPVSMRGVMVDITSLKETFRRLSEQEEQYRAIFEATSDGLIINDLETGVVLEANPAACRMHGYEDMTGMHPTQFIHPNSHHIFDDYMRITRSGGEIRTRAQDIRSDGSILDVEVLGRGFMYQGRRAALGVVRDVTEQVQREVALQEAFASLTEREQQYRSIFESTGDSLLIHSLDAGYPVVTANPAACEMWGYGRDEIVGVTVDRMFAEGDPEVAAFAEDVSEGTIAHLRSRAFRSDGSVFDIQATGVPFAIKGQPHLLCIQRDISEQVRHEQLLEEKVEQRTSELATLLEVSRKVASTLDLRSLLNLILEEAKRVVEYARATFYLMEGDELVVVAAVGDGGFGDAIVSGDVGRRIPFESQPLSDVVRRGDPILVADVDAADDTARAWRSAVAADPSLSRMLTNVKSWIGVPLVKGGEVLGLLTMSRMERGYFSQRHVDLATAFAGQAAVAVDNAKLFERLEGRTRELEALLDVSHALASTLEMDSLLNIAMTNLRAIVPGAGSSVAVLKDDALVTVASHVAPERKTRDAALGVAIPVSKLGRVWRMLDAGEPVIIDNIEGDDPLARGYREALGGLLTDEARRYIRSWMGVPLRHKDRVVGLLSVSIDRTGFYTREHARLAQAVASQTALAIENARLFEREHERSTELATLLNVARNVASTLDLEQLLQVILEEVRTVSEYDRASFAVLDGDELEIRAVEWTGETEQGVHVGLRITTSGAPELWEELKSGRPVVLDDVHGDSSLARAYRRVVVQGDQGIRSWMGVPIMSRGEIIGLLALSRSTAGFFNEDKARLARAFADQAAVAIENARLYARLEERSRELESILEVARGVASTLDLGRLVRLILDRLDEVVEYSAASLILREGDEFVVFDSRGTPDDDKAIGLRFRAGSPGGEGTEGALTDAAAVYPCVQAAGSVGFWETIGAGEYIIVQNVAAEAEGDSAFSGPGWVDIRSWMAIPLALKDRVIGYLGMARNYDDPYTDDHARLARAFADHAAIAIENARLYEQAQRLAVVEERQRLARELHDSVSQALYGIALGARTARTLIDQEPSSATEPIEYVLSLAEAGLAEMRALIFELRPDSLENEGLIGAIRRHVVVMEARHAIAVEFVAGEEPDTPLEAKEAVYRIIRESLHNVVKHAKASKVRLALERVDDDLTFSVSDNGRGFDPALRYPGHVGLASMRERAQRLGGSLVIESSPGKGTTLRGSVPINQSA